MTELEETKRIVKVIRELEMFKIKLTQEINNIASVNSAVEGIEA